MKKLSQDPTLETAGLAPGGSAMFQVVKGAKTKRPSEASAWPAQSDAYGWDWRAGPTIGSCFPLGGPHTHGSWDVTSSPQRCSGKQTSGVVAGVPEPITLFSP